VTALTRQTA